MTRLLKEHKEEGLTSTECLKLIAKNWKALGTNGKAKWNADHGCAPPKRIRTKAAAAADDDSEPEEPVAPRRIFKKKKPVVAAKPMEVVEPDVHMDIVEPAEPVEPEDAPEKEDEEN
jgi:hypothetical protein